MDETGESGDQRTKGITVLLAEDHALWRGAVKSMLEDTEFQVTGEAASSREALEIACRVNPQLTLLDIRMANGNGLDTLVKLKLEHPQMCVILLSAYENPVFMKQARAKGASGYCIKGVDRDHLLANLRAALPPSIPGTD